MAREGFTLGLGEAERGDRRGPVVVPPVTGAGQMRSSLQDSLQILAHLSHEIRTPLSSVLTLSQLLRAEMAGPLTVEQQKYMEVIERSVEKLSRLVGDVLDLSRLEMGAVEVEPRFLDLGVLIRTAAASLAPKAAIKNIELVVLPTDGLPRVRCDPDRLRQILTNLIDNAVKFTERGQVTVSTTVNDGAGQVVVHVSDTGIGLSAAALDRLLAMPFPTGPAVGPFPNPRPKNSGAGLGLAIASRLVHLLGGRLFAESREGVGSRFTFTLPTDETPASPAVVRRSATSPPRKTTRKSQRS